MSAELQPIDITNMPDLARLAEKVRASNQAIALQRDHETVAVIVPAGMATIQHRPGRKPSVADREAFLAAAGSWKGLVDGEQLKKDIAEAR